MPFHEWPLEKVKNKTAPAIAANANQGANFCHSGGFTLASSMHLNHISGRRHVNLQVKERPRCCIVSSDVGKLMNNRGNIYDRKVQAGSKAALLHTLVHGVCGVLKESN